MRESKPAILHDLRKSAIYSVYLAATILQKGQKTWYLNIYGISNSIKSRVQVNTPFSLHYLGK